MAAPPLPCPQALITLKASFIVPLWEQEHNVLEVIRRLTELPLEKEIEVVDDGWFDSTPLLLQQCRDDPEVLIHLSQLSFGKGTVIAPPSARPAGPP